MMDRYFRHLSRCCESAGLGSEYIGRNVIADLTMADTTLPITIRTMTGTRRSTPVGLTHYLDLLPGVPEHRSFSIQISVLMGIYSVLHDEQVT